MKRLTLILVLIAAFISNPIAAQSKKELKKEQEEKEYQATKALIESGNFMFEANSCTTQRGRRIDLVTNINYMNFEGSTVTSEMPFFGGSQLSHYESSGGFQFVNEDVDYIIDFNDKKRKITIKFKGKGDIEIVQLFLNIYASGNTTMNATSTHRDFITYRGEVKPLKSEKE